MSLRLRMKGYCGLAGKEGGGGVMELLFSIGPKDFKWDFFKTSGPGGQNKNKRDTACRCTHIASGAIGIGSEEREQGKKSQACL